MNKKLIVMSSGGNLVRYKKAAEGYLDEIALYNAIGMNTDELSNNPNIFTPYLMLMTF